MLVKKDLKKMDQAEFLTFIKTEKFKIHKYFHSKNETAAIYSEFLTTENFMNYAKQNFNFYYKNN